MNFVFLLFILIGNHISKQRSFANLRMNEMSDNTSTVNQIGQSSNKLKETTNLASPSGMDNEVSFVIEGSEIDAGQDKQMLDKQALLESHN